MQNTAPKVMHFVHWTRSGITSIVKTLCQKEGHSFVLLYDDEDFFNEYAGIKNSVPLKADSATLSWIWTFISTLRSINPEIIHSHSLSPFVISCILAFRARIVFHVHSEYPYLSKRDIRSRVKRILIFLMTRLRKVTFIAVSQRAGMLIQEVSGQRCHVLPNALPDEGSQREPFSLVPNSCRFYSVCRLSEEKNLYLALNIIKGVYQYSPHINVVYDIYGEGPLEKDILNMIGRLGLQHIVSLKGWSNAPSRLASEYDFYLSTSRFEGFGLSILSALRGRNIAIITDVGELAKNLASEESCFVIESEAISAIETVLRVLSMSEGKLDSIQESGRSVYVSKYGYRRYINELQKIYAGVLN